MVEGGAIEARKLHGHGADLRLLRHDGLAVDDGQRIIQEMGVDLRLQQALLQLPLPDLVVVGDFNQLPNMLRHVVEAALELADFINAAGGNGDGHIAMPENAQIGGEAFDGPRQRRDKADDNDAQEQNQ